MRRIYDGLEHRPCLSEEEQSRLRRDYFLKPDCPVFQNPGHFCFNSDSFALASFCQVHAGQRILEIGTNNAALLLYLDRFSPGFLCGVEILEEPARLAAWNLLHFAHAPWKMIEGDIQAVAATFQRQQQPHSSGDPQCARDARKTGCQKETSQQNLELATQKEWLQPFDLIVCNPPFFPLDQYGGHEGTLSLRQLGRFEQNLDLEAMVRTASALLRSYGRFCFIHRPERLEECFLQLEAYHLHPSRLQIVYDGRNGLARAILIEAVRDGSSQLRIEPALMRS